MVIESLVAVQTEDTKYQTEFTVVLKEIRRASSTIVTVLGDAKRNQQIGLLRNNGINYGSKTDLSVLPSFR
jgi:hypothetical protein